MTSDDSILCTKDTHVIPWGKMCACQCGKIEMGFKSDDHNFDDKLMKVVCKEYGIEIFESKFDDQLS